MSKKEYLWLKNIDAKNENNEHLFHYDLSVFEGDVICIVSSTFSKKRLVSNLILGYAKALNGRIYVNEKHYQNYDAQVAFSNGISSSESTNSLVTSMTIEHNLFALRERNNPLSMFNQKAAHVQTHNILNKLGLSDIKNKLVQDLSEYEQQMVCIAKSVINHAKIIVVNETSKNSYKEKMQYIENIKTYSKQGVAFVILCDEMDEFVDIATRIQYISDSGLVFEFKDKISFMDYINDNDINDVNKLQKRLKMKTHSGSQIFEYGDVILEKWLEQKKTYEIAKNVDDYLVNNLSIKENVCLGVYSKLSNLSILNEGLIDFTYQEARRFANIIKDYDNVQNLTHLQKLLLLIYRVSLQNFQVLILDDIFSEMDDFEWNHLIKALNTLVEKDILVYLKNCNSYLFNIQSPHFYQLDRRNAIMIKKDT